MEATRIAALLDPFLPAPPSALQIAQLSAYLDLLLLWNRRINLTAVRDEESIVLRHFGESLFAASCLLPPAPIAAEQTAAGAPTPELIDLGSGAGFPGLVMKIYCPALRLTLIEAQQKKATFLREVIRQLQLSAAEVLAVRAESCAARATLVSLRAVEQFERIVAVAASLLRPPEGAAASRLALLIGELQAETARRLLPAFSWQPPINLPESNSRILLVGSPV